VAQLARGSAGRVLISNEKPLTTPTWGTSRNGGTDASSQSARSSIPTGDVPGRKAIWAAGSPTRSPNTPAPAGEQLNRGLGRIVQPNLSFSKRLCRCRLWAPDRRRTRKRLTHKAFASFASPHPVACVEDVLFGPINFFRAHVEVGFSWVQNWSIPRARRAPLEDCQQRGDLARSPVVRDWPGGDGWPLKRVPVFGLFAHARHRQLATCVVGRHSWRPCRGA